jgi:imidazolonepropionase-like amidohydrolase
MRAARIIATSCALLLLAACQRDEAAATTSPEPRPAPSEDAARTSVARLPDVLIRNARVLTAAGTIHERADVLVRDGRIAEIGPNLSAEGIPVVDASGKTVTPGIIDTHSHMGVYAAPGITAHSDGNEIVGANTAYARAHDGYWPQDPQLEWARAGGITTAQILPGSANLIGGRAFTVKLHPGALSAAQARFPGAPDGLKMACGENPKRVYGEKGGPSTRMGNLAGQRKAFEEAKAYREKWRTYERELAAWNDPQAAGTSAASGDASDSTKKKSKPEPPTRDFGLETLAAVLDGKILVHNHCYRADEMVLMLDLAREYGFQIRSFHYAVEAYKIADVLAKANTAASIWADWWGFKAEAFDGVRENAAILAAVGGKPIIHSDDPVGIQRLNQEAAKAWAAGKRVGITLDEDAVLRWITANPAWALGIDAQTGTLEPGKMADMVIWNGSPFSVYAKAEKVFIDGVLVYDRFDERAQFRSDFDLGMRDGDLPRAPTNTPTDRARPPGATTTSPGGAVPSTKTTAPQRADGGVR